MAPFPTLHYGQKGNPVRALQRSLRAALLAKGAETDNLRNGVYGEGTRKDVARFKKLNRMPALGKDFGGDGEWGAIMPHVSKADAQILAKEAEARAEKRAKDKAAAAAAAVVSASTRIAAVALRFYAERDHYVYRQTRPMPADLFSAAAYNRLDCSASSTLIYKAAGLPDPNGRGYDGYGFTGTLWPRGVLVRSPQAGDLAFYGYQDGGIPSHVAVHISPGEVVSFGSTPVKRLPVRYRSDYRGSRRYV